LHKDPSLLQVIDNENFQEFDRIILNTQLILILDLMTAVQNHQSQEKLIQTKKSKLLSKKTIGKEDKVPKDIIIIINHMHILKKNNKIHKKCYVLDVIIINYQK
jgi:hypothetical protein